VSELLRFDQLDHIIGLNIASCSYNTTEMEREQMTQLLKAIKEIINATQAKTDANREADREEMLAKIDIHTKATKALQGKVGAD
jgi:hypothetical protein